MSGGTGRTARAVGVDLGARRIGVAVSDAAGALAFPRAVIGRGRDRRHDHEAIAAVVAEVGATTVVVGLPLSLDGGRGPAAVAAADEAAALSRLLGPRGVSVETFDERFTTVAAAGAMASAGKSSRAARRTLDSAAAAVLLQSWLDAR